MIPSSRSLLSSDKRLPLDKWNRSGLQDNVFGNQFSALGPVDIPQTANIANVGTAIR